MWFLYTVLECLIYYNKINWLLQFDTMSQKYFQAMHSTQTLFKINLKNSFCSYVYLTREFLGSLYSANLIIRVFSWNLWWSSWNTQSLISQKTYVTIYAVGKLVDRYFVLVLIWKYLSGYQYSAIEFSTRAKGPEAPPQPQMLSEKR